MARMGASKTKVSMTIDKDVYDQFRNYCKQNGMKVSSKVELLMKETVKNPTLKKYLE